MDDVQTMLKLVSGAVGSAVGSLIGGFDGFIHALIMFMAIDYITGLLNAIKEKNCQATKVFGGLCGNLWFFR